MKTLLLLTISNVFMTIAWYGHLRFKNKALWIVIVVSWAIAFFEYCFQVPANRIGSNEGFTAMQLKLMQEAITLTVFVAFSKVYFPAETMKWNYWVGLGLIAVAAFFVFHEWKPTA